MRSTLKPAICFLKPPASSSTISRGTRTSSKWISVHSSPDMNFDGLPLRTPLESLWINTEPMPPTPGPKRT
jgi:hypothetical protein